MPTDFKYVPQNPDPISGVEVLKQTERAINELGGEIDAGNETANEALQVANSALTSATNAVNIATSAGTTAQNALSQVEALTPRVTAVESVAANALAQANTATDNAAVAQTTANAAQIAANNAQTTANAAQSASTAAQDTADAAQALASSAQVSANNAMAVANAAQGIYEVDDTANLDANEYYLQAQRIYVTGATPQNFPPEVGEPIWFAIFITDDGKNIIQECHDSASTLIYTRVGTVNFSDPENPVVTFSPWNSVAIPEVITSITVEVDPSGQPAGTYLVIVADTSDGPMTLYVNLSQIMSEVYSAGNGGISISPDYKISLQLDTSVPGLTVTPAGLASMIVGDKQGDAPGYDGSVGNAILMRDTLTGKPAWEAGQSPIAIMGAIDFNTYHSSGLYMTYSATYTNGPPCGNVGGILEIKSWKTPSSPGGWHGIQRFTPWHTIYQGIEYTRGYYGDTNTWSEWFHNGWQIDFTRGVSIAIPTAALPYTMPYNGYINVKLSSNHASTYSWVAYNGGIELFGIAWDGEAYTVTGDFFAHVPKGTKLYVVGICSRFIVNPCRGE